MALKIGALPFTFLSFCYLCAKEFKFKSAIRHGRKDKGHEQDYATAPSEEGQRIKPKGGVSHS